MMFSARAHAAFLAALLSTLASCGGSTSSRSEPTYSPAPTPCPGSIVRADHIEISELSEDLKEHLPAWLPESFGLKSAFARADSIDRFEGRVIWTDDRCRIIDLTLYPGTDDAFEGPRVGGWTVTADVPSGCGNSVLGSARCLNYHATVEEGTLVAQMMGVDREDGDRVVQSAPL